MRLFALLLFACVFVLPGCGSSSPEEDDASYLASPEAVDEAAAAREKYTNTGKEGPKE